MLKLLVSSVGMWLLLLAASFCNAALIIICFHLTHIPVLDVLTYWQVFWLVLALMLPLGTSLSIHRVMSEK